MTIPTTLSQEESASKAVVGKSKVVENGFGGESYPDSSKPSAEDLVKKWSEILGPEYEVKVSFLSMHVLLFPCILRSPISILFSLPVSLPLSSPLPSPPLSSPPLPSPLLASPPLTLSFHFYVMYSSPVYSVNIIVIDIEHDQHCEKYHENLVNQLDVQKNENTCLCASGWDGDASMCVCVCVSIWFYVTYSYMGLVEGLYSWYAQEGGLYSWYTLEGEWYSWYTLDTCA